MTKVVCVFFILMVTKALAQKPILEKLNGKVIADLSNLAGIYVINLKTEKATVTNKDKEFSITAALGGALIFSLPQFKTIKVGVTTECFQQDLFSVKMNSIGNQLKEVIVKRFEYYVA